MELSGVFLCEDMLIEIVEYLQKLAYFALLRTCKDIYAMKDKFYINYYVILHYKIEKRERITDKNSAIMIRKCEYYDHIIDAINKNFIKKLYLCYDRIPMTNIYEQNHNKIKIKKFPNLQYFKCHGNSIICVKISQNIKIVKLTACDFMFNCAKIDYLKIKENCYFRKSNDNYYIQDMILTKLMGVSYDNHLSVNNLYVDIVKEDIYSFNLFINEIHFMKLFHTNTYKIKYINNNKVINVVRSERNIKFVLKDNFPCA